MPAALVGAAAGVMLLVFMNGLNGSNRSAQPVKDREDSGARTLAVSSPYQTRLTAPVMKWNQVKQSAWGRDGSRTLTFELPAEDDVSVWMKRVRPLLVVRCQSRNTEVFVVTSSAASFEKNAGRHTVHVGFDGSGETQEVWEDSVDSQQLFAPDGVGLTRRIAEARTMTFRFTPFNASPVTAEFNVRGFDEHLQAVAKTCRW
ncbi:MAG: type VI secretion system-associated protein TagO [Vicinamibacterales bacterium]